MDTTSLIASFTPSKILIQTSVLPLITVEPAKKTWLGSFLDPKIYAIIGNSVIKIDPSAGNVALSSQEEIAALPNNWPNVIALGLGIVFAAAIIRKIFKK
jgi:hypothetical protein